ncbi:hypothetical protein Pcinc_007509 [Petrolisthes cinctipes]|uniref:Uncharacterized protein n=1 Tax=Petrolisthes cinctipes TaxID=88211 RepID=A0AAE1GAN3_PETCI|nr:hypothetical protein Pcinc_007509 [Petrolisthes cinctipes]
MGDYSFETLKLQAEALKLSDADIAQYVISQQAIAREERARERELHIAKMTTEQEKDRLKHETEQEKVRLQDELEMAKLKSSPLNVPIDISRPSLPIYRDGEDMATYLVRFERIASLFPK